MVVQALIDSLSRCLGAPGGVTHPHTANNNVNGVNGVSDGNASNPKSEANDNRRRNIYNRHAEEGEALAARRRQGRALGLELHDQEWDALFEKDAANDETAGGKNNDSREKANFRNGKNSPSHNGRNEEGRPGSNPKSKSPDIDVGYADVFAKAKEAAQPSRHTTPRKTTADRQAEIFRCRATPNPSFASRLLASDAVFKALCFANPVHDCNITMNYGKKGNDNDGTGICTMPSEHSVAEETMTSTVCFENKFNHQTENRPPMPLFNRFKVDCDEIKDNELISIVNSGSHHSIHMLKEFQRHNSLAHPSLFNSNNNHDAVHVTRVADDLLQDLDSSQEQPTGKRRNFSSAKARQELNQVRYRTTYAQPVKHTPKMSPVSYPFKGEKPPDVQAISDSMSTNNSSPSHHSMTSMKVSQENSNILTVDLDELNDRSATNSQQVFAI